MRLVKFFFFLLIILSALAGCQNEADEIMVPPPAQAFSASSSVADLIARSTLLDGSSDNILDNASCVSLILPVTVLVNGQEVIVNTEDDLKYVERIFEESDSDADELNIVFPINVALPDYSQLIVQNEDELEILAAQCTEGGLDDDIECIDFTYPVKLAVYNTRTLISEVVTIDSNESLNDFINALVEDELVSFTFPVVMQLLDGTEVTISDNDELEAAIENAAGSCDEDDDTDFDDDDIDTSNLVATLVNGSWKVNYFFDESNQTSQFDGYSFTFNADGSAIASNGVIDVEGNWAIYGDDGELELVLDFGEDFPFDEIMEDWKVSSFTAVLITMKDNLDEPDAKTLILEKL